MCGSSYSTAQGAVLPGDGEGKVGGTEATLYLVLSGPLQGS